MRAYITALGLGLVFCLTMAGCSAKPPVPPTPIAPGNYTADIQTDMGDIQVQLFADKAPLAVGNFVGLAQGTMNWKDADGKVHAKKPFYDGLTFHRVIAGFMIQGGDVAGNGSGDPGYGFATETSDLKFDQPGRLGMAHSDEPNSNGSQFFITLAPQPTLDGQYTIFGQVTKGMDVANAISNVQKGDHDMPVKPIHIQKVTITKS